MAIVIHADQRKPTLVTPADGRSFTLQELQTYVGGYLEVLETPWLIEDERLLMFLNENGKLLRLPENPFATEVMRAYLSASDIIVGDVVVCTRVEAGEHDDTRDDD